RRRGHDRAHTGRGDDIARGHGVQEAPANRPRRGRAARQDTTRLPRGQGSADNLYRLLYRIREETSTVEELSVTEAARRGVARLVADAAHGDEVVVTRHHRPLAAVVGIDHLRELERLRADLRDLALAGARSAHH